jgi:rRNA biogenesis protein RRP5
LLSWTGLLVALQKRHRAAVLDLELNEEVNAVVEIVKDSYVVCNLLLSSVQYIIFTVKVEQFIILFSLFCSIQVLSVPEYNYAIGFAPLMDYNSQLLPHHNYDYGQR